ncbi:unnamed protein product [Sphenostylis stenocarpa]|uniref:RING-type E3 ubiquitin transferase n=1 Tax=Sphenostylis stenocarpa TaxID=92480 RepID=A0AA86RUD6_9FABA|nr:unnamed protein product [Sphenostylis stenocarpa]
MTPEFQQTFFSDAGTYISCNDKVNITVVVETADTLGGVRVSRPNSDIYRDFFSYPSFRQEFLETFLAKAGLSPSFLNSHDCDMIANLSRMLRDSILQHSGVERDYFYVFAALFKGSYFYNVVNTTGLLDDETVQSREFVQNMAYEGGEQSLPAGATTLQKLRIEDERGSCFICHEEFNCGDNGSRLPCSHICHYDCIIQWFVHNGTCPLCRFTCTRHS